MGNSNTSRLVGVIIMFINGQCENFYEDYSRIIWFDLVLWNKLLKYLRPVFSFLR